MFAWDSHAHIVNWIATTYVLQVYVCGVCPSRDDDEDAIFHYYGNSMVVDPWWGLRDYHQNLATVILYNL